jgi:hypothetical protein
MWLTCWLRARGHCGLPVVWDGQKACVCTAPSKGYCSRARSVCCSAQSKLTAKPQQPMTALSLCICQCHEHSGQTVSGTSSTFKAPDTVCVAELASTLQHPGGSAPPSALHPSMSALQVDLSGTSGCCSTGSGRPRCHTVSATRPGGALGPAAALLPWDTDTE